MDAADDPFIYEASKWATIQTARVCQQHDRTENMKRLTFDVVHDGDDVLGKQL